MRFERYCRAADIIVRRPYSNIGICVALVCLGSGCGDNGATRDAAPLADASRESDAEELRPLRVLFVGNSYTEVNDLPAVVRALAEATPGASIEVDSVTVGGATLGDHWLTTGARDRIATGGFDTVVLQGQSLETVYNGAAFRYYANLLSGALGETNTRGVWFATWPRRPGDPFYESPWPYPTPALLSAHIESYYAYHVSGNDFLARVGAGWLLALDELPEVVLYQEDGSHPSAAGTLLTACVMLQAITGQTPRLPDPPPLGIPAQTANALCALAPRVACRSYAEPWDLTLCDGACVRQYDDFGNCGACGDACSGEDPCIEGVCGCPASQTACNHQCVDVLRDNRHCGTCYNNCGNGGKTCQDGSCVCQTAAHQSVSASALSALKPGCVAFSADPDGECIVAVHEYCAAQECFTSGIGSSISPGPGLTCISDNVVTTTYTELSTWVPGCDGTIERVGENCASAIHQYCMSTGATGGFGPVSSAGDNVTVTCVADAFVGQTDFQTLGGLYPGCDGVTQRWGPACSTASLIWCSSMGYLGGFGPVGTSGTSADVICVNP